MRIFFQGAPHTIYNLSSEYCVNEVKEFIKVFSVLESIKLIDKKSYGCGNSKQTFYVYIGPNIANQEIKSMYDRYVDEFELKNPKLVLTHSKFDPENRFRTKKFSDKIRFNRLLRECGH